MGTELWYPIPKYLSHLKSGGLTTTVQSLCAANAIPCKFEGVSAKRQVLIVQCRRSFIECLPHQKSVRIGTRHPARTKAAKKYALAAMAYALFDLAARQSVQGHKEFSQIKIVGRPRSGRVLSNSERQRKFRRKGLRERSNNQQPNG